MAIRVKTNEDGTEQLRDKIPAANLPAPGTTTLGGVKRNEGTAGQFVTGIDASGNITYAASTPGVDGGSPGSQLERVSSSSPGTGDFYISGLTLKISKTDNDGVPIGSLLAEIAVGDLIFIVAAGSSYSFKVSASTETGDTFDFTGSSGGGILPSVGAMAGISFSRKGAEYTLPVPTTTVIGGVKRNTGAGGEFVTGIDTDGSLLRGTPSSAAMPSGAVIPYAGSSAPTGYLFCQGAAVSRTTYSALFDVIGTTYGAGDGSTTFNVPDMGGRVPAGKEAAATRLTTAGGGVNGGTLGAAGGAQNHTLLIGEIPAHTHNYSRRSVAATVAAGSANRPASALETLETTPAGGSGAHFNTQPTLILNYIIKT